MEEEKEILDVFETHGYKRGQELLIDAEFLLGVLSFCRRVQESQPKVAALTSYPKQVREIRGKEGDVLERVDIEWAEHTPTSFSNTAFSEEGGVGIVTDLSMYALQIENGIVNYHLNNINSGVAIKVSEDDTSST
jgi:hypothetical protein